MKSSLVFSPISFGLGDMLFSMPIIHKLLASHKNINVAYKHEYQRQLLESVIGLDNIIDYSKINETEFEIIDFRSHWLQTDYKWGSLEFRQKFPNYYINDILKQIAHDFDIDCDFDNLIPLKFNKNNIYQNTIIFIVNSDGQYKSWPIDYWLELANLFKNNFSQYSIIMLGDSQNENIKQLVKKGLEHKTTNTIKDALDIISNAHCAIGIDTGLIHLSSQQGIKNIILLRPNSVFYRQNSNSYKIEATNCHQLCLNQFENKVKNSITQDLSTPYQSWDCLADKYQQCMSTITPKNVFKKYLEII